MIWLALCGAVCVRLAIDVGSHYIKAAMVLDGAGREMVVNREGRIMTPSAVAFKIGAYPERHLTAEEAEEARLLVGDDAVRLLKRFPQAGSANVPRVIGRNVSGQIVSASAMLALLVRDVVNASKRAVDGVVVTVPYFYTMSQRFAVIEAMWSVGVDFHGIVDDIQAVVYEYFVSNYRRSALNKVEDVLFVDVGGCSTKAYRVHIEFREREPSANATSYEFTEMFGGLVLAERIAALRGKSVRKAHKMIDTGAFEFDELEAEFHELASVVKRALNGNVDVVQLLGGASKCKFVEETIRQVVGKNIEIRRDLHAFNSVALGSVLVFKELLNASVHVTPNLTRCSPYNTYLQCNTSTEKYCDRSSNCSEVVLLEGALCHDLYVRAAPNEVPRGASTELSHYKMLNISKFYEDGIPCGGFVKMTPPYPIVEGTLWCTNDLAYCDPIKVRQVLPSDSACESTKEFINHVIAGQSIHAEKERLRGIISDMLAQIESHDLYLAHARESLSRANSIQSLTNLAQELKHKLNQEL